MHAHAHHHHHASGTSDCHGLHDSHGHHHAPADFGNAFLIGIGLNIVLPHEQAPNLYVTPELSFNFHYFATRKIHFLLRARAVAIFPGGFGTLDEFFETLTLIQTGRMERIPLLLFGIVALWFVDAGNYVPFNPSGKSLPQVAQVTVILTMWALCGLEVATVPAGSICDPAATRWAKI